MTQDLDWFDGDGGEEVIWQGQPHINSIYPSLAIGVVLIPAFGLGLLIMAFAYLDRENKDFVITDQGV